MIEQSLSSQLNCATGCPICIFHFLFVMLEKSQIQRSSITNLSTKHTEVTTAPLTIRTSVSLAEKFLVLKGSFSNLSIICGNDVHGTYSHLKWEFLS